MMTTPRFVTLVAVLVLAFSTAGCAKREPSESAPLAAAPAVAPGAGEIGASSLAAADRSLVVTMDVSVTVERVDDATARLRAAVERAGGFVADSHASGTGDEKTAHLELRVPASEARSIRAALGELGEVTSATEKIEDVTEQRADIEARLVSARTQEKRLLEIMSGRAASIQELVEAERELARVRENVERLEAQQRVMKSKVALATVRVSLATKTVAAWQTPGPSLSRAGSAGVRTAAALAVYTAMAFAAGGPTLLPILAVIATVVIVVRRRRAPSALPAGLG
ncbi:MAG: DUF4349 domain-containing protein [Labilithrix sp.]|nr:DUF4349 domain-containing protein [Labilithrix sp.]